MTHLVVYIDVYTCEGEYLKTVAPYNPTKLSLKEQQKIGPLLQIPSKRIVPLNCLSSGYDGFGYLLLWPPIAKPVAMLSDGTVITTLDKDGKGNKIVVFLNSGMSQKDLQQLDISKPIILGTNKEDGIYISSEGGSAIYKVKFKSNGFEKIMEFNTGANPVSVAVDDKGQIFVALGDCKVERYSKDGKLINKGSLPLDRVVLGGLRSAEGNLYCLGKKGRETLVCKIINVFNFNPIWKYKLEGAGEWDNLSLAVSSNKKSVLVYVGGAGNRGKVTCIVDAGSNFGRVNDLYGDGHLVSPFHLVVDKDLDLLFVIDQPRNKMIKMKASDGSNLAEWEACWRGRDPGFKGITLDKIRKYVMVGYSGHDQWRKIGIPEIKWEKKEAGIRGLFLFDYNGKYIPLDGQKDFQGYIPNRSYAAFDREGNIFASKTVGIDVKEKLKLQGEVYSNLNLAKQLKPEDLPGPIEIGEYYHSSILWSLIDKYSSDGKMIKESFVTPCQARAGIAVDSKGFIYTLEYISGGKAHASGQYDLNAQALVKYAPGGIFGKKGEMWHRCGMISRTFVLHCGCGPRAQVSVDEFDRIFATDIALHNIKVFDTAGNLIMCIGGYGTQEFQGLNSNFPDPEIALCRPSGVSASENYVFISDTGNSRIVKCKIVYTDSKTCSFFQKKNGGKICLSIGRREYLF